MRLSIFTARNKEKFYFAIQKRIDPKWSEEIEVERPISLHARSTMEYLIDYLEWIRRHSNSLNIFRAKIIVKQHK